ncbi:VPLPA-CTERM sorting domain-containing protein [Yoonia sp. 208BN28-4]|uniref:VPLPA-CTERM sorting domain-containing protein n=1 Tax=Yoonia sp. 208BN28-4 TaxID=3126505 RepID=UPI00309800BC
MSGLVKSLAFSLVAVMLAATPTAAATTFYTDRAAFDAATNPLVVEDFADTTLVTGLSVATSVGQAQDGIWRDRPTPVGAQTTWSFAAPVTAFGADFDLSPGGQGTGLKFLLNGTTLLSQELQNFTPTFFGFISDDPFGSLLIQAGTAPVFYIAETHDMDNLSFGNVLAPPVAPVPLPAAVWMLLAGLGAVFSLSRRKAQMPSAA